MKMFFKVLIWIIIVLVLIQLIPIDFTNKPVRKEENFVEIMNTPEKIQELLKTSCYDCHSNETVYPKIAKIAPISWAIKNNVNKARRHLNFSEWGTYNQDLKRGMLRNASGMIMEKRMPISGYVVQHPEAQLSEAERKLLANYFDEILKTNDY